MRDIALSRYFHLHQTPLSMQPTYSIAWSSLQLKIINHTVPPSMSLLALNGNIVGLCVDPKPSALKLIKLPEKIDCSLYPKFLKVTPLCYCVGLGAFLEII